MYKYNQYQITLSKMSQPTMINKNKFKYMNQIELDMF